MLLEFLLKTFFGKKGLSTFDRKADDVKQRILHPRNATPRPSTERQTHLSQKFTVNSTKERIQDKLMRFCNTGGMPSPTLVNAGRIKNCYVCIGGGYNSSFSFFFLVFFGANINGFKVTRGRT